ncbi:TIGR03790 family protein [Mucilaginibacter corticis]|nr:TIGR03790 family protein [Mucilaginibacter corticis]
MKRRGVTNSISINCPDGAVSQYRETIAYPDYVTAIETPLLAYLNTHSNIDFIVFTKGVPMRISNVPNKPYEGDCSLDSRVATLGYEKNAASSVVNVSDPNYGSTYVGTAWVNKFFNSETRFSHKAFGGYMVTRLDGYTLADAIAVTTRSLAAENNLKNGVKNEGQILLDACSDFDFLNKAAQPYTLLPANYKPGQSLTIVKESAYGEYNSDMGVAYNYLKSKNIPVLYDTTADFIGHKNNLAGYVSWGSNDGHYSAANYNSLYFSPGAIAETAVSTSARTLLPTTGGQSLIEDLVAQGVTGVKGYTDEPLLQGIASPSILFNRYTRGWTLAESFYAASRLEGWMGIVIGDPICTAYASSSNK